MTSKDEQRTIKAIRHLQQRSETIEEAHDEINRDIHSIKRQLSKLGDVDKSSSGFVERKQAHLDAMSEHRSLPAVDSETIYNEAEAAYPEDAKLDDILTAGDWKIVDKRIAVHVKDFNARYALDGWDYAIAGGCGLFAAMLDLLFVKAPAKPTTAWTKEVDGVFNGWVQQAFNSFLPPDVSKELGRLNTIGGADSSTVAQLIGALPGTLNPMNHRLRSLSHDPILGFLFGVLDMLRGTCTVVGNDGFTIYQTTKKPMDGGLFPLLGRLFGHLLSDVNAPSEKGNRGMGVPAPFMGILRMFDSLPVGDSDLGKQIEYMYVKGYDFRQFVVTSIPVLIMEVMMRVFYAVKQVKHAGAPLGEALMDTMPLKMNPRFKMMLAMAYGTVASVNGAKVYITKDILNLNYAAWIGFIWNGSHAIKWALLDRSLKLWGEVEQKEIEALERVVDQIDGLSDRAERLPV
ncbi:MAG: hypothetical protein F4W91_06555 [Gemmatimonadetes bacterium]|nr:hypothetical protein [Gemmatimonadota bacterium]